MSALDYIKAPKEKRTCNLIPGKIHKFVLKIVTLYTTKAVVVTKCSNVLLPLLNFAVYTVYYWCYMPSTPLESISPRLHV